MKNTSNRILALAITTILLGFASTGRATADFYGPNHPYAYGHDGYWDEHHGYHHWDQHNGHNGYWHRRDDGVRVFVTI